jgi:diguanylate cyclase (GGDEF)-like protein
LPEFLTATQKIFTGRLKRMPVVKVSIAFIIVVCASIIGLSIYQLLQARDHELDHARMDSTNLAKAMAQQAADAFDEANIVLSGTIELFQANRRSEHNNSNVQAFTEQQVRAVNQLHGVFIYGKDGEWLLSSFGHIAPGANNADREYFQFHATHTSLVPRIGTTIHSRTTGEWIIPLSRRINDDNGQFLGVALATIKMSYFDKYFASFGIGDDGVIFLARADGTILARRPFAEENIGASLAKGQIFSNYLPYASSGVAMVPSILDGVMRLYGYRTVENYNVIVAAGISRRTILAEWQDSARNTYGIIFALLVVNTLFGFMLVIQLRYGVRIEADLRDTQSVLEELALKDSLTGLANRRLFEKNLELEFLRGQRGAAPLSLLMLDIDFFKSYNDRYGHVAGDACIVAVANVVKQSLRRPGDLGVRYGGEEIAILLPDTDSDGALNMAEAIRLAIYNEHLPHADNPEQVVTVSMGCHTEVPGMDVSVKGFVENADSALYLAKRTGRNRSMAL